jgi:aminoglycoside phosphotransferase (APT) family kinase protein
VHGDFHLANLGLERGVKPRLILLDWARPTFSAPGLDLAFLLGINGHELPISHDEAIELYGQSHARHLGKRFHEDWWEPQLKLSLLAVLSMTGCFQAFMLIETKNAEDRKKREESMDW